MKTNFVRHISLGLAAGLTFFLGCARPSAQSEQPRTVVAPASPAVVDPGQAGPAAADTNAPAIVDRIPASARPENVAVSPGLSEVAKLAQAGVGEEVILAFVEKYSGRFELGSDQILYLNDLGVPPTVITSMLKHDGTTDANVASLLQTQVTANVPQTQVIEQPAPTEVATSVAPPPTSTEVSYFYDTLSPYGSWVYLSGYGWCWQPTVAVSVSTWRPYCDRGRWYWSDSGWYWSSDYSWGWAAFHYGRWYRHPGCGWVWTPGTVWAPSWVSWRYSDGYCGWAPLPPEAHFVSGVGFSFHGRHVSVGFDFGLHDYHYSFVHLNNFCDYAPYRYVVPHTQVQNFYRNTTVINNYIVGNNNTIINRGIGRETIARASTTRMREISVRETPVQNLAHVRGDRIERQGNQTVVYRPQLPKTPPAVRTAQFVNRGAGQGQGATTVARGSTAGTAVTTTGPSRAGNGRAQTGIGTRPSTSGNVETARPQGNASEERPGRAVVNQRGNPQPNTSVPQARPARQQPRANAPLFGAGTASTAPQTQVVPPENNSVTRNVNPANNGAPVVRARPQVQQNNAVGSSPAMRVYPQGSVQPEAPQPSARGETRSVVRGQSDHSTMSPRGYEQAPRYNVPAYQAPAHNPQPQSVPSTVGRSSTPQNSAPERTRPVPGGGGRGEAAPSRVERSERNR